MNPQQPDDQTLFSKEFLEYMAGLPRIGCEPPLNDRIISAPAGDQEYPTGFYRNTASGSMPSNVWPPQPQFAMGGVGQPQPPLATASYSNQQVPPQYYGLAHAARPAHQQVASHHPPPPRGYLPQPQAAARNIQRLAQAWALQQPLLIPPIVPSQAPPAPMPVVMSAPGPCNRVPPVPPTHVVQQRHLPQNQMRYAPPPYPPPHTTVPPPREQSVSPWASQPLFSPWSTVSTAATTPGTAFGRTIPLPAEGQIAPQVAAKAAYAPAGGHEVALRATPRTRTLKRRIADVDAGACVPGPSKRPATDAAVQARSVEKAKIGGQVRSSNQMIPTQRAPSASTQRDATPGLRDAPEAAVLDGTSGPHAHSDPALSDEDDDSSLFGDGSAATSALGLTLGSPHPTGYSRMANEMEAAMITPPTDGVKHASPLQLVLPGMDTQPGPSSAQAALALCLPGTDAPPQGQSARTGPRAHLPRWTPSGHGAVGVTSLQVTASAAAPGAAQSPVAPGGGASKKPRAKKKKESNPSNGSGTSSAGSASRGKPKKAPSSPASQASKQNGTAAGAPEAARNATLNHELRLQNPGMYEKYSWMTTGAGSNTAP